MMLSFSIPPVCANAYRLNALLSLIIAGLYLFTPLKGLSLALAIGGLWRGFVSPHRCPLYQRLSRITLRAGKQELVNAGPKRFADKIAGIAGVVMFVSWLFHSPVGKIPATAVMIFAFVDVVTSFCVACWAYNAWYHIRRA